MSAVFVGENALTLECAQLWLARGHQVAGVASETGAVRQWARDRGIPEARRVAELAPVRSRKPFDYLFSVVHLGMLPAEVLALPRVLPINFHDGLLPADAGLHASAWVLTRGATTHGITWHVMTARADAGDILVQREFGLGPQDTSWLVNMRCYEAGLDAFAELTARVESGTLTRTAQDLGRRTYHPAAERPAGALTIDPGEPAERIAALVRACDFGPHVNGFGTAKLDIGGRLLAVRSARVTGDLSDSAPGTVLACAGDSLTIATATHDLILGGLSTLPGLPADLAGHGITPGGRLDGHDIATPGMRSAGHGITPGRRLAAPAASRREALTTTIWDVLRHEAWWVERLESVRAMDLPYRRTLDRPATWNPPVDVPGGEAGTVAAVCAFLARIVPGEPGHIGLQQTGSDGLVAAMVPLAVPALEPGVAFEDYRAAVQAELDTVTGAVGYLRDVFQRYPRLHAARDLDEGLPIVLALGGAAQTPSPRTVMRVEISPHGGTRWFVAREALSEADTRSLVAAFATFQRGLGTATADRVPLLHPDRCVHQLVAAQSARTPHARAVAGEHETLTYQQLQQRVEQIAAGLAARGAGPGELIGVHLRRTPDLVAALLAVLTTGAAYVPLDPVYPPERIAAMLADAQARLLLVDGAPDPAVKAAVAEVVHLQDLGELVAVADRGTADGRAYVIYTSGSTGRPKGVQIGHRALTNLLTSMAREPGLSADDQLLAVTTICFDIAALELFGPLITGGLVRLVPAETARDGHALLELMERTRPTVLQATPVTWKMLIAAGWGGSPGMTALCGGEALGRDLADELLRRADAVWNLYGPTETTIWSTVARVLPGRPVRLGAPVANTRLYIVDRLMQPMPDGIPGELCIGGDGVAEGYLHRPELTADRFRPDPFHPGGRLYRTGDLVHRDADGELEFLGRNDHQLKIRGFRIELGEIEAQLTARPEVAQAVVVPCEDGARLAAYLTAAPGQVVDPPTVKAALAEKLPDYMVPATLTVLNRLPHTANGKIDRAALPAPTRPSRGDIKPRNDLERRLCGLFAENLGCGGIAPGEDYFAPGEDYFALGGDSLRAVGLVAAARKAGIRFSVTDLFHRPTPAALASYLDDSITRDVAQDLAAEVRLPMHRKVFFTSGTRSDILLTGATGFVGAFLLRELAALPGARVTCLVRPRAGANLQKRLRHNLERYGLELPPDVRVIGGDLTEAGFGLGAKEWERLAAGTGTIVHAGASVHFLRTYRELAPVNVAGTREVLRLAAESGAAVHHLSSMGVFGHGPRETERQPVRAVPGPPQRLVNGYQQSKWVAEGIAALAAERGTALAVHRVARVCGAGDSGACQTDDLLWRVLKGCVQAQGVPGNGLDFDLVPVDEVARAVASLVGRDAEGVFHHASPALVSFERFAECLREAGYALPTLGRREWTERIEADPGNAARPLLEAFAELAWGDEGEIRLEPGESAYPEVDARLIARQVNFLQRTGFLPQPSG